MCMYQIREGAIWMIRVKKCVLLGVSDDSKAWRIYDPIAKKIVVSKDVIFEE